MMIYIYCRAISWYGHELHFVQELTK